MHSIEYCWGGYLWPVQSPVPSLQAEVMHQLQHSQTKFLHVSTFHIPFISNITATSYTAICVKFKIKRHLNVGKYKALAILISNFHSAMNTDILVLGVYTVRRLN
jgi:hypothetical protein